MGLGGLNLPSSGRGSSLRRGASSAPKFFDTLAEARHETLFSDRLGFTQLPQGFRAEDVIDSPDLEGFVTVEEAAKRMEISEDELLDLARSAYLLSRWHRGRLLVRPGIL